MAEENASFYLMVLVAMVDDELHDKEAKKIKQIAHKFKIDFDPYEAADEIKLHYKNDFNKASDFYISIIQNTEIRKDTTDFIKEFIYADSKIHDREVKLLEKCKKEWNIK
jgi:uncharacterized tellurite resistance protein B-like protein